ncbi:MAG: bifunctional UDP-N-acetylmuramoyl-tripeptide:D-alanyl-D-alanine ligase/alanine racemase [Bacteroidaceae bacterium]|nr:bifunctional UDP-N-acetylmuramoyl-tripeptide:D-alanyl-D-alanine ligase/alanine racemase [Bacteroidaceae bacterium]
MTYTIQSISDIIGAERVGTAKADIDWLLTDSRSLTFPEESLFFAIRTSKNDGHRFIGELYRRGVRNFVVEHLPEMLMPDANYLRVASTMTALQQLARSHRERFDIPIVGITGSNGKTIVKEWLYQLTADDETVTRSPRSWNSQLGVPLSVWRLEQTTTLGIFEAGISDPGYMDALQSIIQPTIGILTCIGPAHDENFGSRREKCMNKLRLFRDVKTLIYHADDELISDCISRSDFNCQLIGWSSTDSSAPIYIDNVSKGNTSTEVSYKGQNASGSFTLPFIDDASIEDAIHCLCACLSLGLNPDKISQRMSRLEPVAMRLEVKEGLHGCTLITDSYNSDLNSLEIALDFMRRRPDQAGRRRTLILSDIKQTGLGLMDLYKHVLELVQQYGIEELIGIGPEISAAMKSLAGDVLSTPPSGGQGGRPSLFPSTSDFLSSELFESLSNRVILIKGARSFRFEHITEALEKRVHETILEVNLAALTENLRYYRSFMRPETKMVCMVKASAYGAGAVEVAKTLQAAGVDYLAVAVADEGAELRRAGITSNIIVMNPEMSSFHTLFEFRLEPEVYSFRLLKALIHTAERAGITNYPIHLKLDTGMHRLGFDPERDLAEVIHLLTSQTALIPRSVFSHFVGSDSEEFDMFSAIQFDRFLRASEQLQASFPHHILRHICNSAGIEHFPERHLDMVRLGLGLYGVNPITPTVNSQMSTVNSPLTPISTLKTTILQIREVPKEETVGYSRRGHLTRDSRIAAIPIGYADGLNRHLGCGNGYCLVAGKKAPYIGNICMDVCMIDVTDIPCEEGDPVLIFGPELPPSVLAEAIDTIPYEILTSVSPRVKRIYYWE